WIQITTPHFVVYTDLDARSATDAGRELETIRDAVVAAAGVNFEVPDLAPTRVFILDDEAEFERAFGERRTVSFVPGPRAAFYLGGAPAKWPVRTGRLRSSSALQHPMAHLLAAAVFPSAPRWFDEGLALFLETVAISDDGRSLLVGRRNVGALEQYDADGTVT